MLGSAADLTRGRLLARNVGLNLGGWALPALCGLVAIPALVRAMGAERFGLLALAWTLVGVFSPFDLGIGRALTQALAERAGRADEGESPDLAWSAAWLLLAIGSVSTAGLALAAPALASRWLHVSPLVQPEAARALRIVAFAIPLTVLTSALRGVLEAGQAFRAVNALRIPLALLSFVGPLVVQPLSHRLEASLGVLVIGRLVVLGMHVAVVWRLYPQLRSVRAPRRWALGSLWRVGGWMTLSTLATPVLVTGDRFLIGAALPMAALAQYAAVSEVGLKLTVVGGVLQPVLFPALAATLVSDPPRAVALFDRAVRVATVAVAPAALVLVTFAPEGLRFWLGPELAREATPVLRLLAIASYINTFAQLPFAALQSAGRADLPAKLHVVEVPLYLGALWLLLARFGLVGAAIAFLLRMLLDALALFSAVPLVMRDSAPVLRRAVGLAIGGAAVLGMIAALEPLYARALCAGVVFGAFACGASRYLVTADERALADAWLGARRAAYRALRRPAIEPT